MRKIVFSKLFWIAIFTGLPVSVYFIDIEIQSYWGRQAFRDTGLTSLTLAQSIRKAAAENKMILVDVSAEWCRTCRKLDKEVFSNDEVRKTINEKFAFSRLEYESAEGMEFLKKQNAKSFPGLWLLDSNGNVTKKLRVTFNPGKFLAQLQ